MFNALQTAALEISEPHDLENGHWMKVGELEEMYIPPFVKDAACHQQGEIIWTMNIDRRTEPISWR